MECSMECSMHQGSDKDEGGANAFRRAFSNRFDARNDDAARINRETTIIEDGSSDEDETHVRAQTCVQTCV